MSQRTIIFDFDGTLADTHKHSVDIFNSFAEEFGYKTIPWEDIDTYKNMSIPKLIRKLHVPVLKIPTLMSRGRRKYNQLVPFMQLIPQVRDALLNLRQQDVRLGILSSNSKENILLFLENNDLMIFDFIYSTSRLTSKNSALMKLLAEEKLNKEDIVYVGDEIRDILAAHKINVAIAAVAWGFNSGKTLLKHKPTYFLEKPGDLMILCSKQPPKKQRLWLKRLKPRFATRIIDKIKSRRKKNKSSGE